jgi:dUTP pyrophosphatase
MSKAGGGEWCLRTIGRVHSSLKSTGTRKRVKARIEIFPDYTDGLKGIEVYDELLVLYWMDRLTEQNRKVLVVHPKGDKTRPKRGVFSTRSPLRPNPIGLSKVRLLERGGNVLEVEGLDAVDGTPVIDLKKVDSDY